MCLFSGINLTIYLVKLSCGLCGFLPSALQLFLELTASALGGGYLLTQVFDLRCCALYAGFQRFKVGLGPLFIDSSVDDDLILGLALLGG